MFNDLIGCPDSGFADQSADIIKEPTSAFVKELKRYLK